MSSTLVFLLKTVWEDPSFINKPAPNPLLYYRSKLCIAFAKPVPSLGKATSEYIFYMSTTFNRPGREERSIT